MHPFKLPVPGCIVGCAANRAANQHVVETQINSLLAILKPLIAVVLVVGCGGSIHPSAQQLANSRMVTYDQPYDIIVQSDPPGARIVVDAETLAVRAPLTVRHTRKRRFGIPDVVNIRALAVAPGQCAQHHLIAYDSVLPDTIVFRMMSCPTPDQDYSRVFTIDEEHEVGELPQRLSGPMPLYPENLQRAHRGGIVFMEVVIDTTGKPEPATFRVVVASDSGFIQSARAAVLGSVFKPGRVSSRKVRTQVTIPIIYQTVDY